MNNWDYVREVNALHASERLRRKIAALPERRAGLEPTPTKWRGWSGIVAALVLVVGLGVAAPTLIGFFTTGGDVTPAPPVAATPSGDHPEGIIADGIDVSPVILDAAKDYVRERYDHFVALHGEGGGVPTPAAYDNWRIEGLSAVYERKELADYTVAVFRLDYRLHTTTPEIVKGYLVGGMDLDDEGWLLPTYPDSTYLVFILNYSTSHYFATTINDCSPGSELFDELIMGGIEAYVAPFTEKPAPTPAPQAMQGTAIDALDYAKLEAQMDAGDWADLQEYFPILREGARFLWVAEEGVTGGGGEDVTLEEYYRQRFGPDLPDGKLDLERFTLFGFAGTGKQDLVLCFLNGGGHYLILHREGEQFYGFERGYRSFLGLQRDGMYTGSSGATYNSYYRIKFQAGFYEEELLGQRVGERYEIGGQAVSAGYFWQWRQNCMVGDMDWYYPAQPTGRQPPPSTEDERRYHVSISGLPLEEPFLQLPVGLLATLEDTGEVEDWAVTHPERTSPWIMKTYRSPSLEVETLMVPPEMLEELLAEGSFTREQYDAALGTEYIYTARPLDSSYPTGSGLRLGDSAERARALFYAVPDSGETVFNAVLANLIITTEDGVVTGLYSCSGGRTVGGLVY